MLHSYLRKSKAYFDGTRVLIDGGKTFRDFIRVNKDSQRLIKKLIAQVSGVAVPIGPYEPRTAARHTSNAEQSLHALEKLGLDVSIEDSDEETKITSQSASQTAPLPEGSLWRRGKVFRYAKASPR